MFGGRMLFMQRCVVLTIGLLTAAVAVSQDPSAACEDPKFVLVLRENQSGSSWITAELNRLRGTKIEREAHILNSQKADRVVPLDRCATQTSRVYGFSVHADTIRDRRMDAGRWEEWARRFESCACGRPAKILGLASVVAWERTNLVKRVVSLDHKRTNCRIEPINLKTRANNTAKLDECRRAIVIPVTAFAEELKAMACNNANIRRAAAALARAGLPTLRMLYEDFQRDKLHELRRFEAFLGEPTGALLPGAAEADPFEKSQPEDIAKSVANADELLAVTRGIDERVSHEHNCSLGEMFEARRPIAFGACDVDGLCQSLTAFFRTPGWQKVLGALSSSVVEGDRER